MSTHNRRGFPTTHYGYTNHNTSESSKPKAGLAMAAQSSKPSALEASAKDCLMPSLDYRVSVRLARDTVQKSVSKPVNQISKFKNPNEQKQT